MKSGPQITISRPLKTGTRSILVHGEQVGTITPTEDHGRNRKWAIRRDVVPENAYTRQITYPALSDAVRAATEDMVWPVPCWISMSGDHGYLPDNTGCGTSRWSAVESLIDLFELGDGRKARALRKYGYTELGRRYGAEYAEVMPCECEQCRVGCTTETEDNWECEECAS